jgi:cation:H+ antiporter
MELLATLNVIGGLVYLVMGGDLLIRGSISIARRFNIPPAVVGATIVAFGTSLPELVVSLLAATTGHGSLSMGNVIGSNLANVLIVLGIPAIIAPVVADPAMRSHAIFMVVASGLFVGLCLFGELTAVDGMVLLGLLAVAILLSVSGRVPLLDLEGEEAVYDRVLGLPENPRFAWLFIAFGAVVMPLGANLTVDGATELAASFGISEAAIGATVVALGTSLPELSVSVMAAIHRQPGMAIGNAVGSNTLNILVVIGITTLFADLPVPPRALVFDLWLLLACALFVAGVILTGRSIGRRLGICLVLIYAIYVWQTLLSLPA